jgi:hypothetical protein
VSEEDKNNRDDDATEVSPESGPGGGAPGSSGDSAEGSDYTEYRAATQTAGFDQARELAQKAGSDQGRLLKKRFVLEDVLGEGGMGLVYRARDLRKVEAEDRNPYVAVKVLGKGFREHPQAFVSLQQEAVKSQKLAHPNIVTVYDFDREGNTIFMTMELLKGDPLDALLRLEAPFSKEVALRYFRDLCAGLEYAHQRGLIHSDFKPGNIFVTTGGTVKILDFGIARAASKSALTHDYDAGELGALTPAYATAEMVRGEAPSPSDDIYALACVLYLMLTGEHPYQRKSAAEAAELNLKPLRPACLNNREWAALAAALNLEKAKRPASIAAFREAMLPPRRGGSWLALGIAGLVVLAVAGWYGYEQYRSKEAAREAMLQRLQAGKDCYIQRDYECAVENALVVSKLAPDDREAQALLAAARQAQAEAEQESLVQSRLQAARDCLQAADYACARRRLVALLELVPDQLEAQQLLRDTEEAERRAAVENLLTQARECVSAGDIPCVREQLAEAQGLGASAAELYPVQRELDALVAAQMAATRDREERLRLLLDEARACLKREDFACAEARAAEVLAEQADSPGALEVQQAVRAGREQRAFREQTVANFLAEAQDCFERKNYSCAIAKSESALAIVPGHSEARQMIERANKAQKQAKMNITIE